jgi:hypothetical protein
MPIEPSIDPSQLPKWVLTVLSIYIVLLAFSKIKQVLVEDIQPIFYNPVQRRRRNRRQRFADHVESEVRRLNNLESWNDNRFSELEAEVEFQGHWMAFSWLPFIRRSRYGTRRERSLSKALQVTEERLILVEGDPGSGKSVALRYVTKQLAQKAAKSRSTKSTIPIYVNLRELERSEKEAIDRNLIETFILKALNRASNRDVEAFLDEEFQQGLQDGTWLFLFDSFDEIPEVLSSTEADQIIQDYSGAIYDFLHGMNKCRGIVASRYFRGPDQAGFHHFRILPLTEERKLRLIRKAFLPVKLEQELLGELGVARYEIREMTKNPMFLSLLCQHMEVGNPFPKNPHSVFESYIDARLKYDAPRLQRRFNLTPDRLRRTAESVAFAMSSDNEIGLSPNRERLKSAMVRQGIDIEQDIDSVLDALEYIKIARTDTLVTSNISPSFTFAHRRFQEYFATNVVLREQHKIQPRQLLTDARWRETAVVLFQTQNPESLKYLFEEIMLILSEMIKSISNIIDKPLVYISSLKDIDAINQKQELPQLFAWPQGFLHLLSLLQDGFANRAHDLPDDIRVVSSKILLTAYTRGILPDRKWALEVAGVVPQPALLWLLRSSLAEQGQWMRDITYHQATKLGIIPEDVASWIRKALVISFVEGRLRRERFTTRTHLSRLDKPESFISVMDFILSIKPVDLLAHILFFMFLLTQNLKYLPEIPTLKEIPQITDFLNNLLAQGYTCYFALAILVTLSFLMGSLFSSSYDIDSYLLSVIVPLASTFRFFILFATMIFVDVNARYMIIIVFICVYMATWSHFAAICAYAGLFTQKKYWPFIQVLLPYYALINMRSVFGSIVIRTLNSKLLPILALYIVLSIVLLIALGIGELIRSFAPGFLESIYQWVLGAGILLALLLSPFIFIGFVYQAARSIIRKLKDWQTWRRWSKTVTENSVTGIQLIGLLDSYYYTGYRTKTLQYIREKSLLKNNQESEGILLNIILTAEIMKYSKRNDHSFARTRGFRLKNSLGDDNGNDNILEINLPDWSKKSWLQELNPDFLDQAAMLVERLRLQRQPAVQVIYG